MIVIADDHKAFMIVIVFECRMQLFQYSIVFPSVRYEASEVTAEDYCQPKSNPSESGGFAVCDSASSSRLSNGSGHANGISALKGSCHTNGIAAALDEESADFFSCITRGEEQQKVNRLKG